MKVDKNKILILHRYFIWANEMRTDFDGTLGQKKQQRIKQFMYMSLWYGMLYVVIGGWYDLGLNDSKVDELLKSKNVNLLKRYRNGVFHFQKRKYYDRRFMDLIQNGEEVVVWVQNLNKEIGRFFLEQLK